MRYRRRVRAALSCLAIALGSACAEDATPCGSDDPALVLGLADGRVKPWTALPEPPDAVMEIGTQGGFHLWTQVRAPGACDGPGELRYRLRTADTGAAIGASVVPVEVAGGELARAAQTFVCPAEPPTDVVDRAIILDVDLDDAGGVTRSARADLTIRCPDVHPLILGTCRRVCTPRAAPP